MTDAKEILKKHLGPVRMEDAVNRLADMVENGHLLAATDPVEFLNTVADKLQSVTSKNYFEIACANLGSGHWTREMPQVEGTYFTQAVNIPSEVPSMNIIYRHNGELKMAKPWGGWWWSDSIPEFPATPDYKHENSREKK